MADRRLRVLVVSRSSKWEDIHSFYPAERLRRLERARPEWLARLERSHHDHLETLTAIRRHLASRRMTLREPGAIEQEDTSAWDLVVAAGGDGTVLWASHHVDKTPILGVKTSRYSAGHLTGASRRDFGSKLDAFAAGRLRATRLHRMSVLVDDRIAHDKVLNEALFSHHNPAVTTRYLLELDGAREDQMSSGLWVGPAAGTTAAMRSAGGRVLSPSSRNLQFVVREPIQRPERRLLLLRGLVRPGMQLTVTNEWQPARLYLDGPHLVIPVEPGQTVRFALSPCPLMLLGWSDPG